MANVGVMLDKPTLEKFVKILAMKTAQIVVQSRLGERIKTDGNPLSSGNDWVSHFSSVK